MLIYWRVYLYIYILYPYTHISRCFLPFKPQLTANFGSFHRFFLPLPGRREWRGAHALPGRAQRLKRHMPSRGPKRCHPFPAAKKGHGQNHHCFPLKTCFFFGRIWILSHGEVTISLNFKSKFFFGIFRCRNPKKSIMKHGIFGKTGGFSHVFFRKNRLGDPEGSHGCSWAAGGACVGASPRSTRR